MIGQVAWSLDRQHKLMLHVCGCYVELAEASFPHNLDNVPA